MKNTALTILTFICLLTSHIEAQKLTISGNISDSSNNERLIAATITCTNTVSYCITNQQGFYSLTLEKGPVILCASYVGYRPVSIDFTLNADTLINFQLSPSSTIDEAVIIANNRSLPVSTKKILIKQITQLPSLAGESDVMKTMQLLPGIQSGSEGQTGFYIKGGEDDQNLVLLDGVPVYNPNHLFGFFSVFNEHAIQDVTLYTGNFPARYGGRLSSVVDIQTKEGNGKKMAGAASVGALASTINLEGPLLSDKTTFFISGRISYFELLAIPIIEYFANSNSVLYRFYDYNVKLTHRINKKQKLTFSHYRSYDYGYTDESGQDSYRWEETTSWGNRIFSLAWNYAATSRLFINTVANYSKYDYNFNRKNLYSSGTNSNLSSSGSYSLINDKGLHTHVTWYTNAISTLRAGIGYNNLALIPGADVVRETNMQILDLNRNPVDVNIDTTLGYEKSTPNEFTAYVENEIKFYKKAVITAGLRYSNYHNHCLYQAFEPRLNLSWELGKASLSLSYSESHQFNHMLKTSNISQATDLWVPSTKSIQPEKARQLSFSARYRFFKDIEISAEAYYKLLTNLVEYQEGISYSLSASSWEDMVTFGTGKSYGIIFALEKKTGKTTGWISYTLSRSVRQFAKINYGEEFPFTYSRPHDFKIVVMQKLSKHFDVACAWIYHSGNNISYSDVTYFGKYLYYKHNGYRLPDYHRLDINVNYYFGKRHLTHNISLGAYNAYNRKNIYNLEYYYTPTFYDIDREYMVHERTLFSIIPSLTYRIKF